MAQEKPLPFIYQFGAGAVAGVSEVKAHYLFSFKSNANTIYNTRFW